VNISAEEFKAMVIATENDAGLIERIYSYVDRKKK
jgi:hypothetical protein